MTNGTASPRRLKIGFVITELEVGGAEQCLTHLATNLDPHRFAPAVFSLAPPPPSARDSLVRQLQSAAIPTQFLGATSWWETRRTLRRLKAMLAEFEPDIVQTFLFHANVLGTIAARKAGIRQIAMGIRVGDPSKWRQIVENWAARRASHVVAVSQSVAQRLPWLAALPAGKLSIIPNGIDMARFAGTTEANLASLGIPAGKRVAVTIGRLHVQKGMDWLLESARGIFDSVPDLHLLVIGSGPEESRLRSLARNFAIQDRVHFLGWRTDVLDILQGCHLFILPSRWEGMPNALLESMAAGLPVVATRVEGVAELLGPDSSQIVDFGDTQALVTAIRNLMGDAKLAAERGAGNRQRAASLYSLQHMVRAYEALYERMANPHRDERGC